MSVPINEILLVYTFESVCFKTKMKYSQTCIKRSPLEQRKSGLIRQVTSSKRLNSYELFYDRTRKGWPFNTGDCLIELTTGQAWQYLTCIHLCPICVQDHETFSQLLNNLHFLIIWLTVALYYATSQAGIIH